MYFALWLACWMVKMSLTIESFGKAKSGTRCVLDESGMCVGLVRKYSNDELAYIPSYLRYKYEFNPTPTGKVRNMRFTMSDSLDDLKDDL